MLEIGNFYLLKGRYLLTAKFRGRNYIYQTDDEPFLLVDKNEETGELFMSPTSRDVDSYLREYNSLKYDYSLCLDEKEKEEIEKRLMGYHFINLGGIERVVLGFYTLTFKKGDIKKNFTVNGFVMNMDEASYFQVPFWMNKLAKKDDESSK
ncbi:MAG: hypothetical protein LUC31_03015 [Coprobacillus sp.]|nr:hypothetical protein [Coprobacillus sp.]